MTAHRRLAAVMFLDMVGYSALMSRSEAQALTCVRDLEAILRAEVAAAGGRLVKLMGDGSMAEFPTGGAAVACARRIQEAVAARKARNPECPFDVRVGLHLGEVAEQDGDLFGDAVNIAARVQPLADPGGIAMTGTVHAQVKNQGELRGMFLPPTRLKNIPERISVFAIPPPEASLAAWKLKRRGLPAAAMLAAAALALLMGFGAWRALRPGLPTLTLFFVQPPEDTLEWRQRAQDFDQRMVLRGGAVRGFRWQDRDLILAKQGREALADLNIFAPGAKTKACILLREIGIDYAIYAYLNRGGRARWKLDYALIDSRHTDIVASDSVEADDLDGLSAAVADRLSAWAKAGKPRG